MLTLGAVGSATNAPGNTKLTPGAGVLGDDSPRLIAGLTARAGHRYRPFLMRWAQAPYSMSPRKSSPRGGVPRPKAVSQRQA